MASDPMTRFRDLSEASRRSDVDVDDDDAFIDPDDGEDCRAGLLELDRPDDDDG